jgi:type 1 glutamine amidotransferase
LEFEFSDNGETLSEDRLGKFPIAILARANLLGESGPWLTAESQAILPDYVRRGNGLMVVHGGLARYESLPAMNALIGGAFIRHPQPCEVTVEPAERSLITKGVTPFAAPDEHYFVETESDVKIFLESRSSHGVQPAGWTRCEDGGGRVCVLTPGHTLEMWLRPEFQKILLNALRWITNVA